MELDRSNTPAKWGSLGNTDKFPIAVAVYGDGSVFAADFTTGSQKFACP